MRSKYFIFFILAFSAVFSSIFPAYTADDKDGGRGVKRKPAAASQVRSGKEEERNPSHTATTGSIREESVDPEANSSPVFIIGGVGQGNMQAAIIGDFAFLYDVGTSSQTVHRKIVGSRRAENTLFLKKQKNKQSKQKDFLALPDDLRNSSSKKDEESARHSDSEHSVGSSISNAKGETETVSEVDFLRSLFIDRHVKVIMCWVSHADIDHYNLVSKLIPNEAAAFFFLCGDFLSLKERNGLNRERRNLLKFISERKRDFEGQTAWGDTHVSLPYYWGSENYNLIHDYVLRFNPESDNYDDFKGDISPGWPPYFSGTFGDLMDSDFNSGNLFGEMKAGSENFFTEMKALIQPGILNLLHVWSLNHVSSKRNNQCPVVSISVPEIGMSFVCTGDANDDVFGHICQNGGDQLQTRLENYLWSHAGKPLITLFVIPHHGSINNYSKEMLLLFLPNVLAISAGSGTMHGHPDHELIRLFKNAYEEGILNKKAQDFWNQYTSIEEHLFLSFEKEKQKDKEVVAPRQVAQEEQKDTGIKAYRNKMSRNLPVFLTNMAGALQFTVEGIESQYVDNIVCGPRKYKVDFSRAIRGVDEGQEKIQFKETEYSVDSDNPCYFLSEDQSSLILKVEHESGNKYYQGNLIPGGVMFGNRFYHISYELPLNPPNFKSDGSFQMGVPGKRGNFKFSKTEDPNIFLTSSTDELIIKDEDGKYYLGRAQ